MTAHPAHLRLVPKNDGPTVVALGGGHGLAATLRAARRYASDITAVVSVADDGGSTGRLRAAGERLAPGDLRKCLVALAADSTDAVILARAMEHRFNSGDLSGHAVGNLMLIGLAAECDDLVKALDVAGGLLQAVGRVLPATKDPVHLRGRLQSGELVDGQVEVGSRSNLSTVTLEPADAEPCAEAILAVAGADQIVLGPGSLYTSVLAATAVPGMTEAIAESPGQFVYVCNLHPQSAETEGYDVADHVAALDRHGLVPDVVLYDPSLIGGADGVNGAVAVPLARPSGLAHDAELLGSALSELAR
ncbi:MAG TPA: uridine diphosphate-N-acetylglucosamine-binding protein YvcK [Microthrixaceae bacterium]|nr:uridine diphosphate-N-acetylglucosamine-binding protein YvcK [Microthrixaceae bacterium]